SVCPAEPVQKTQTASNTPRVHRIRDMLGSVPQVHDERFAIRDNVPPGGAEKLSGRNASSRHRGHHRRQATSQDSRADHPSDLFEISACLRWIAFGEGLAGIDPAVD